MAGRAGGSRVGVVLAGAGARGAYEAGALSVLLPALEAVGQRPTVFVGTSAGGFNAALLASLAHRPATEAAAELVATWRRVRRERVFASVAVAAGATALRYSAGVLGLPVPVSSLLDTGPLAATAADWLDWEQLHRNTTGGAVHALAVVATSCATGRSVAFSETAPRAGLPGADHGRGIDYAAARLAPAHLLASAAIPVAFGAQYLDEPPAGAGWYLDGGTRLNAPIKPALAFGVDRLVVVATDPATPSPLPTPNPQVTPDPDPAPRREPGPQRGTVPRQGRRPDVDDAAAQVLHGILVDRMIEDVRTLGAVNTWVTRDTGGGDPRADRPRRRQGYREVPYLFCGPARPGLLAQDAAAVFAARYRYRPWRDYALLSRLIGAHGASHGELLSFLFFDPAFLDRALARGRADARALLRDAHPTGPTPPEPTGLPWRSAPPDGMPAHRAHRARDWVGRPGA